MRKETIEKAPRAAEMYAKGAPLDEIAARLRMSRRTITKLVRMQGGAIRLGGRPRKHHPAMRVPFLAPDHLAWVEEEAARLNITQGDLMKAMLVDAIEEARNGH